MISMALNGSTGVSTMDGGGAPDMVARELPLRSSARERRKLFEGEVLQHLDAMYSFALKLSRSRDEAQDLVSETILRALERWEQYQLGTNARAWLFTILYRIFVSRKRRIDARELTGMVSVLRPTEDACASS